MGVPDRESRKPKAAYKPEKIDTPVDMVFYAPGFTMHSFYIPATDENGKPIPSRNKDNSVKKEFSIQEKHQELLNSDNTGYGG